MNQFQSNEFHPTFQVDWKAFTLAKHDNRMPRLFKVHTKRFAFAVTLLLKYIVLLRMIMIKSSFHATEFKKMVTMQTIKVSLMNIMML